MRIATWNVNSIRQRLSHVLAFLKETEPDALCLQELKCVDADFPRAEIEELAWVDPAAPGDRRLAPLLTDAVLPALRALP